MVLAKKQPRKVFVQPHTQINKEGEVELVEFEASAEGMFSVKREADLRRNYSVVPDKICLSENKIILRKVV